MLHVPTKYLALLCAIAVGVSPVSALAASIMVDIPEQYQTVKAGDRVYFHVEFLYPENTGRRDFRFAYSVREGENELATAEFLKAVDSQVSFMDYAIVPENASAGMHTVSVTITDDKGILIAEDISASFQVIPRYDWATAHFYMLLAAVVLVGGALSLQIRSLKRLLVFRRH